MFSKKLCKKTVSVSVQGTPKQKKAAKRPAEEADEEADEEHSTHENLTHEQR